MKIPCSHCSEHYELASSAEYLLKIGLVPFDKPLCCDGCRQKEQPLTVYPEP